MSLIRADGGIGRHVRLRGVCASVRVQVPLRAPNVTLVEPPRVARLTSDQGLPDENFEIPTPSVPVAFKISGPSTPFVGA